MGICGGGVGQRQTGGVSAAGSRHQPQVRHPAHNLVQLAGTHHALAFVRASRRAGPAETGISRLEVKCTSRTRRSESARARHHAAPAATSPLNERAVGTTAIIRRMADAVIIQRLTDALDTFNWTEAQSICDALIAEQNSAPAPWPEPSATKILTLLRRKRQFHLMGLV